MTKGCTERQSGKLTGRTNWQAIYEFSIKLTVLLSSLSTIISKPFCLECLPMCNDLPVTGHVLDETHAQNWHFISKSAVRKIHHMFMILILFYPKYWIFKVTVNRNWSYLKLEADVQKGGLEYHSVCNQIHWMSILLDFIFSMWNLLVHKTVLQCNSRVFWGNLPYLEW